jgi:crotonobetainyl-CoA:carnitine CoA-transferase CaiB-like acyl-CoA transferase
LSGVTVVELPHELTAWAGKLMADLGAEVILVEPPGGSAQRTWGPFLDDEPGLERSLWWWHYHTSKRSVVLDRAVAEDEARLDRLVARADVVLAAEPLAATRPRWAVTNPGLVTVSVIAPENATDLTILAGGGPVWMCGYDDHTVPPVRGGGNQGFQTAGHWAVIGTLVALVHREVAGEGQHLDVSAHAAASVTTESGSHGYLICGVEPTRQTGRHASATPSLPTQLLCADGRYVNAGTGARTGAEFQRFLDWLDALGLRDEFEGSVFLEMGAERDRITAKDLQDPLVQQMVVSVREAQQFVSTRVSAYDFFVSAQRHGLTAGVVYAPEDVFSDPHFIARQWAVDVEHPDLGRSFAYPGQPYRLTATPWQIARRAPLLGEDQELVDP